MISNQELFRDRFIYKDGLLLRKKTIRRNLPSGQIVGTDKGNGYLMCSCNNKLWLVHRIVWIYHYGDIPDGYEIDHINMVPSDNRLENLRLVTPSENSIAKTTRKISSNSSGVNGVYFCNHFKKYHARIQVNKRSKHLGYFNTLQEAKAARLIAEQKYGYTALHNQTEA